MGYTKLKQQVTELKESKDEVFLALCEAGTAQAALYELWAKANLQCGPEDYDIVVEYYSNLQAVAKSKQPQATERYKAVYFKTHADEVIPPHCGMESRLVDPEDNFYTLNGF